MRPLNLPSDSPLEPQLPPWRMEQLWSPTLFIITTNIFGIQAPFQHPEVLHTPVPLLSPRRCKTIVLSPPYCSLGDSHPIIAPEGIYTVPSSLVTSGAWGSHTDLLLLCLLDRSDLLNFFFDIKFLRASFGLMHFHIIYLFIAPLTFSFILLF